jgi:hypothetical protein
VRGTETYPGNELELFAAARHWKGYLAALLRPHLGGTVLEVGAGLGATTAALCDGSQRQWICLEPDPAMARQLTDAVAAGRLPACCRGLAPGGRLIVVAPAHRWLYSAFDAAIGHHRRYTRHSLARVVPPELERVTVRYLDSVGLLASAANRLLLRRSLPTQPQIAVWDRLMVPLSRRLDPLIAFALGKSVLGIWRAGPRRTG